MATFSHLLFKSLRKMLRGGWANSFKKSQEGTAVGFLLVWCGRSATTLTAAGHKSKKKHLDSGSKALPERRNSGVISGSESEGSHLS